MIIGNKMSMDAGHNCTPDTGATGIKQEDNLTRGLVINLENKMRTMGYNIIDCTPYNMTFQSLNGSLAFRCSKANTSGSSFHLCVHFNWGGGLGVEAYAISSTGKQFAQQLCDEISKLGFTNRGVKDGSHLYVVNNTSMPCVLLEVCFVDSQSDMIRYDEEKTACAIIKALTNQCLSSLDKSGLHIEQGCIKYGESSGRVTVLQKLLNNHGYNLSLDGVFGQKTLSAIMNFQSNNSLTVDGIVGQMTASKL